MKAHDPLITVMIPTYRRPRHLQRAVKSALAQSYPWIQVSVYDDASGDETRAVVADLQRQDPRVHYFCHPQNIGAAENFYYGFSQIATPYFSILSDDDFLFPEFFETALRGFEKYPDAAISSGAVVDIDERGEWIDVVLASWPNRDYFAPPEGVMQMIGRYSNWCGTLFCTEKVKQIGPLDRTLKANDVDYLFRIAAQLPLVISKKLCAAFVHHTSSYSGANPLKVIVPGWEQIGAKLAALEHLTKEEKAKIGDAMHEDLQRMLFSIGIKQIKQKQFDKIEKIISLLDRKKKRLKALSFVCKSIPFGFQLLQFLLKLRRIRKVRKSLSFVSKKDRDFCSQFFARRKRDGALP